MSSPDESDEAELDPEELESATQPNEERSLSFERSWLYCVIAGALGSFAGTWIKWPVIPAAFATFSLWVVLQRSAVSHEAPKRTALLLVWLVSILLTIGSWSFALEPFEAEKVYPGLRSLVRASWEQPFFVYAIVGLVVFFAGLFRRLAAGVLAPWVWSLVAGYLAVAGAERGRERLAEGSLEVEALALSLPWGAVCALVGGVLYDVARESGDRRWLSGGLAALLLGLGATAYVHFT